MSERVVLRAETGGRFRRGAFAVAIGAYGLECLHLAVDRRAAETVWFFWLLLAVICLGVAIYLARVAIKGLPRLELSAEGLLENHPFGSRFFRWRDLGPFRKDTKFGAQKEMTVNIMTFSKIRRAAAKYLGNNPISESPMGDVTLLIQSTDHPHGMDGLVWTLNEWRERYGSPHLELGELVFTQSDAYAGLRQHRRSLIPFFLWTALIVIAVISASFMSVYSGGAFLGETFDALAPWISAYAPQPSDFF